MNLSSVLIGLEPEEIGLGVQFYIEFDYEKPVGDQTLCKNGQLHPESEPAKVDLNRAYPAGRDHNIAPYLSQQSINTIEAHILDYLEKAE